MMSRQSQSLGPERKVSRETARRPLLGQNATSWSGPSAVLEATARPVSRITNATRQMTARVMCSHANQIQTFPHTPLPRPSAARPRLHCFPAGWHRCYCTRCAFGSGLPLLIAIGSQCCPTAACHEHLSATRGRSDAEARAKKCRRHLQTGAREGAVTSCFPQLREMTKSYLVGGS